MKKALNRVLFFVLSCQSFSLYENLFLIGYIRKCALVVAMASFSLSSSMNNVNVFDDAIT